MAKNLNNPFDIYQSMTDKGKHDEGRKLYEGDSGFRIDWRGPYIDPYVFFGREDTKQVIKDLTNYDFYKNIGKQIEK